MKKFTSFFLIFFFITSIVYAKVYKNNDVIEGQIVFSKKFKIDLPDGKWTLATKYFWNYHGLNITEYVLLKIENSEMMEGISISEAKLGGIVTGQLDPILYEIMFKNRHDGCYERPEYFLLKFYAQGNVHNCLTVRHTDIMKAINYPDDPVMKGANRQLNNWIKKNSVIIPKTSLFSNHSYFSRHMGSNWYVIEYLANPKIYNAPKNKFYSEEDSEYHKYNIENFPEHKKIMDKWVSISAERHKRFEKNIKTKKRHELDLSDYYSGVISSKKKISNEITTQLKQLNELYKSGVLTKEEFEKAKKKVLN